MSTQDREPIVDQTSLKPPFWKGRYSESKTGNKTINTRSLGLQEVPNTPAAPCCFSLRNLSSEPIFRMAPSIGKSPPLQKKKAPGYPARCSNPPTTRPTRSRSVPTAPPVHLDVRSTRRSTTDRSGSRPGFVWVPKRGSTDDEPT